MSTEEPSGRDVTVFGVPLQFAVDTAALDPALRSKFVASELDTEGEAFLARVLARAPGRWRLRLRRLLGLFLSDFDVNGLLGIYPVFLLSTPHALRLFEAAGRASELSTQRLLDVGAGSGDVTTRLAPLVHSVDCTELSSFMVRRLRRRGFPCWHGAVGSGASGDPLLSSPPYAVISLLNVIDRSERPRSLLRACAEHLPEGGLLLLATPLPYEPFYYGGGASRPPRERLQIQSEQWERATSELWRHELQPLGLTVEAFTRTPYLSGGDAHAQAYVLDDAVLLCRKVRAPANFPRQQN